VGKQAASPAAENRELAGIYLPKTFALVAQLEQPVLGIMPLVAVGTLQIAAPGRCLMIVVFGHGKRQPTTARHQIHSWTRIVSLGHSRQLSPSIYILVWATCGAGHSVRLRFTTGFVRRT
jgi:hypothetical protein